jgi:hypothetical protein
VTDEERTGRPRPLTGRLKERLFLPWRVLAEFQRLQERLKEQARQLEYVREALGRIEARQIEQADPASLREREFRVYSQWGEDGIIRHLIDRVAVPSTRFVEFGVESYHEANTRFLLVDRNWSGLVLDGDPHHVERIRRGRLHWLYDLKAVQVFVTRETIDGLLVEHGFGGDIGLLSIDIDGVDFWIWEAIESSRPAIVVIEYNYRFGPTASVTVPYREDFDRRRAHHSILYYGASLEALVRLGRRKGYAFVGAGSAGLNAFFVRRDLLPAGLPERTAAEGWVEGRYDEAHDESGRRIKMSRDDEHALVTGLPLVEVGEDGRPTTEPGRS